MKELIIDGVKQVQDVKTGCSVSLYTSISLFPSTKHTGSLSFFLSLLLSFSLSLSHTLSNVSRRLKSWIVFETYSRLAKNMKSPFQSHVIWQPERRNFCWKTILEPAFGRKTGFIERVIGWCNQNSGRVSIVMLNVCEHHPICYFLLMICTVCTAGFKA